MVELFQLQPLYNTLSSSIKPSLIVIQSSLVQIYELMTIVSGADTFFGKGKTIEIWSSKFQSLNWHALVAPFNYPLCLL